MNTEQLQLTLRIIHQLKLVEEKLEKEDYMAAEAYLIEALKLNNNVTTYQEIINLRLQKRLADLYLFRGQIQFFEKTQYQAGIESLNQALVIYQQIRDQSGKINVIHGKGIFYAVIGDKKKAKEYFEQCLNIAKDINDRYSQGWYLGDLADPSLYSGTSKDIAENIREKAQDSLNIAQEFQDYRMEWLALDKLGIASSLTQNYQDAVKYFEQLLEVALKSLDLNGMLQACQNLGVTYNELKNYQQAIKYLRQGVEIAYQVGESQGLALALYGLGVTLFKANYLTEAEEKLFEAIDIFEQQRKGLGRNDANKISIFETQQSIYQYLQQVLVAQEKTHKALEVAERGRAQAFVELLQRRLSTDSETQPEIKKTTIEKIQQIAKTQKSTLVEYSIIRNENIGYEKLYIWVIQPHGEVIFREVNLTIMNVSLEKLVSETREYMVGKKSFSKESNEQVRGVSDSAKVKIDPATNLHDFDPGQETRVRSYKIIGLQELYKILIDPIAELLPTDTKTPIIFIPHRELFLVPFSALQDRQEKYLIDKYCIIYSPAIQVLELTYERRQELLGEAQEILVVGNPNPMPNGLSSLPYSQDEAAKIAQLFGIQDIVDLEATEERIRQRLSDARVIHLATHGTLDDNEPLQSSIALAPSGKESNQNGLLTAEEILDYKLNAELVVLSACDTGLGRITGDGVIGLSRCLFAAGVSSVIVSLWQVADESTADLMVEFYKYWRQKTPNKAQALRQAILETKKKYPYPEKWAAFLLIGEAL